LIISNNQAEQGRYFGIVKEATFTHVAMLKKMLLHGSSPAYFNKNKID
jgi:hypothetical protein